MSKIVIFSLMLTLSSFLMAQPCTPDQHLPAAGIFPKKLEDAHVNIMYQQVIQFKAPRDTTAYVPQLNTTLPVEVDSIRILKVIGLPEGMSYECHNAGCIINGGEVGCLLISGTCATPGGYPLQVIIKTSAKAILGVTKIPQTQIDTNTRYGIFVSWPTGIIQVVENDDIRIYPNPASNSLTIHHGMYQQLASVRVYDMFGKKTLDQTLDNDNSTQTFDITGLPKGIYSIEICAGEKSLTKRFVKE
jgi:hypothetical protein